MKTFFEDNKKIIEFLYYAVKNNGFHIRNAFIGSCFYKYKINKLKDNIVYYVSIKRNDYIEFINTALTNVTLKSELNLIRKKRLNIKNIFCLISFFYFRKYARKYLISINKDYCTNKEILYIYLHFLRLNSIYKQLRNIKCNMFVVLGDAWIEENMMINYFNSTSTKTITMQHGLFIDNIYEEKYDKLNYLNIPSKYELCWGNYTYEMVKKYNPNVNSYICGNPTIISKKIIKYNVDCIGIIFDTLSMYEYNSKMLDLITCFAKKNNYKIKIRIHPTDSEINYDIDSTICEFNKNIDDCFLLIGHTSSMLITYMLSGNKVLKFKTDIKSLPYDSNIVFSNEVELNRALINIDKFDYLKEASKFISCCGDESIVNYTSIINKISGVI